MMSTYLPTVFGENLMDAFDDFDLFRGFGNVDRALYGLLIMGRNLAAIVHDTVDRADGNAGEPGNILDSRLGRHNKPP